ncbi:NAD(P)H-dependent oxidoreductase [Verrucomicrobiota bacterium sgz303538]
MDTKPVPNDVLVRQLEWRYAVKKFDPTRKISKADWATLEQALVLSPSSFGLQPWKFFVIESTEVRAKLPAISWGQTQTVDASHFVVLAQRKDLPPEHIEQYINRIAEVRGVSLDSLEGFRTVLLNAQKTKADNGTLNTWTSRQVYIALGTLLTSAAVLGIDACPMEGFESERYDELLGLGARGYKSLCAVALGFRAEDDKYAEVKKARFPREEVIEHI